jgi:hypothetical protein
MILLSGPVAEAVFDPGYEPNFKWADYEQSYRLAQFHCRDGDKAGRLLEYLWSEAERIVNLRWRQVEAVANALLKRSRLTSSEIQEILAGASPCRSAKGTGFLDPLLRGSVYLHAQYLRHEVTLPRWRSGSNASTHGLRTMKRRAPQPLEAL